MTTAEGVRARFEELLKTNPPDLFKYRTDLDLLAVERTPVEDSLLSPIDPLRRVYDLTFEDGSVIRLTLTRRCGGPYQWRFAEVR